MLLMTAICHVFSRLSRFYFVTVQPSAGSSAAYRTRWILASDQRLHKSHGKKNLIWPKISKKKKWKKKCFLACQLMTTQRAPVGLHHYVFPLSASTLKWVGDLPTHNAFAKALWESEFGHNFPNKYRQFQTFQPSQLAFVWAIWHSHNAHVFQMPPSCLFLQFWVFFTF